MRPGHLGWQRGGDGAPCRPRPLRRQRHRLLLAGRRDRARASHAGRANGARLGGLHVRHHECHRGHRVRDRSGGSGALRLGGARRGLPEIRPTGEPAPQGRRGRPTLAGTTVDGKPFTTAPGQPTAVLSTARGWGDDARGVRRGGLSRDWRPVHRRPGEPGRHGRRLPGGTPDLGHGGRRPRTGAGREVEGQLPPCDGAPRRPGAGRGAGEAADQRGRRAGAAGACATDRRSGAAATAGDHPVPGAVGAHRGLVGRARAVGRTRTLVGAAP